MSSAAKRIEVSTTESSWKSIPLDELVEILDNKRRPITKRDRIAGTYPYYGAAGVLDWVSAFLFDEPLVLIGEDGAKWAAGENSAFPISGKTWVNNHAHVLRPRRDRVLDDWLIYYLNAADLSEFISGMTVPKLNQGRLREIPVPLPPVDVQKRVVAVLDQAFAALDRARVHAEANLADAERLAETFLDDQIGSLTNAFGRIRIDAISEVKGGKRLPKGLKPEVERTPYPYISVRDMDSAGSVTEDTVGFISKTTQQSIRRYTISCADVYISIAGTIGKTGVVPQGLDGANLTENAAKLVLADGWLRDFVYWSTRSTNFREQTAEQTRVAAQPKLALQRLGCITIPNADRKSQEALVENMVRFRDCITAAKSRYRKKLTDLANLRQSLLQKAFSGQLT